MALIMCLMKDVLGDLLYVCICMYMLTMLPNVDIAVMQVILQAKIVCVRWMKGAIWLGHINSPQTHDDSVKRTMLCVWG